MNPNYWNIIQETGFYFALECTQNIFKIPKSWSNSFRNIIIGRALQTQTHLPEGKQTSSYLPVMGKWHCTHFRIKQASWFCDWQVVLEFTCPVGQVGKQIFCSTLIISVTYFVMWNAPSLLTHSLHCRTCSISLWSRVLRRSHMPPFNFCYSVAQA